MRFMQISAASVVFMALIILVGCGPKINPNQGFTVTVTESMTSSTGMPGPGIPLPNTLVLGQYQGTYAGGFSQGTVSMYDGHIGLTGTGYYVNNGMAPGYWNHQVWLPTFCQNPAPGITMINSSMFPPMNEYQDAGYYTANLSEVPWQCINPPEDLPFSSSRFAITGSIPSTVTLNAMNPFSTQYGMPLLYIFSGQFGTPVLTATVTASSVASNGASATFPLPSSLASNGYGFITENVTSSGGYAANSFNLYSVAESQTVPGSPFGVVVGAITDAWEDKDTCDRSSSSGSSFSTFPVISLYSKNQVLIGGQAVSVGASPTAVAAVNGPSVNETSGDSCDSYRDVYSGVTQALVANSGTDTITLLDLVNDVALGTITVGNNPVALAVASSGTAAYVANYGDNTVTSVALTATGGSAGATVAVGGKPTSVAVTSGGILWVGGPGFLTEINTQTMAVVATESTGTKSIISLGYSDSVGQLVATTVDGSGNVYADQINPSKVETGGSYQTVASNLVSSLGTHVSTKTNQNVRSYTSTLASNSTLYVNQTGTAPLVVQDGWAVVTVTPTGFTISDITSNTIIVSEATASPVTAIAADPNLNVVYMVMPDLNIVLTVPMPGTGAF